MTRILVCGGRYHDDIDLVWRELDKRKPLAVIQGGAMGADFSAARWAAHRAVPCFTFFADWSKGKAAGPMRNQEMIDKGKPDLVLAFPGGKGTADMVSRAEKAGIKVERVGG